MISRDDIKILIVDRNDDALRTVKGILNRIGLTSYATSNHAAEAWEWIQNDESIRIVIMDLEIPDVKHGLFLINRIRGRFLPEERPILLFTAVGDEAEIQHAFDLGANSFLPKPSSPDSFEAHLQKLIDCPATLGKKLGDFLIELELITHEQLDLAIRVQQTLSSKFIHLASLALYLDFISLDKAMEIIVAGGFDEEMFLGMADQYGMNLAQLEYLRALKEDHHLRVGDILVRLGILSREDLDRAVMRM